MMGSDSSSSDSDSDSDEEEEGKAAEQQENTTAIRKVPQSNSKVTKNLNDLSNYNSASSDVENNREQIEREIEEEARLLMYVASLSCIMLVVDFESGRGE